MSVAVHEKHTVPPVDHPAGLLAPALPRLARSTVHSDLPDSSAGTLRLMTRIPAQRFDRFSRIHSALLWLGPDCLACHTAALAPTPSDIIRTPQANLARQSRAASPPSL